MSTEPTPAVSIVFCDERFELGPGGSFTVGREADLSIDDNLYLHRRFLQVLDDQGLWWLANVGSRLAATVVDANGTVEAWLAPGSRLPLVFARTSVRFTAGPTTYELEVVLHDPPFLGIAREGDEVGETTIGPLPLTTDQRLLILALAEPMLRGGRGAGEVPSSADAARRLGWTLTKFNRKLDNVCQKFAKTGVRGLHGDAGSLASNRRARLVEHALAARVVVAGDLGVLDEVTISVT